MMTGFLHEKQFSRKSFVKGGGALIIGFSALGAAARRPSTRTAVPDNRHRARLPSIATSQR